MIEPVPSRFENLIDRDDHDRASVGSHDPEAPRIEVYKREDGQWGWHLVGTTGVVLARDGGHGFSKRSQAESVIERVTGGDYRECPIVHVGGA